MGRKLKFQNQHIVRSAIIGMAAGLLVSCSPSPYYKFQTGSSSVHRIEKTTLLSPAADLVCPEKEAGARVAEMAPAMISGLENSSFKENQILTKAMQKKSRMGQMLYLVKELKKEKRTSLREQKEMIKEDRASGRLSVTAEDTRKVSGMAIAGFVSSIVAPLALAIPSIAFMFFFVSIMGIVFSAVGLNDIRKNPEKLKGRGFGFTGLFLGITEIVVLFVALLLFLASAFDGLN